MSYSQTNLTEDCVASNNDDAGYDVNKTYESDSDLCRDIAVNAALGDKNNTQRIMRQVLATTRFPQRIVQAILKPPRRGSCCEQ